MGKHVLKAARLLFSGTYFCYNRLRCTNTEDLDRKIAVFKYFLILVLVVRKNPTKIKKLERGL
ncbi:hypothetical protein FD20_GL002267 [Liquorilactobacillus uvarum DSM 19971]|uniref:Uncharacterized protein n=1 Tax=Liquorilactobacillus uvarum DSM 19971 TaxID=1423812 RepID=A0A0R1Q6P1_9LACO|nr:hypothetical protein FD20_GL002267 [Liquorilactobacillus uvarum DSM 19971]